MDASRKDLAPPDGEIGTGPAVWFGQNHVPHRSGLGKRLAITATAPIVRIGGGARRSIRASWVRDVFACKHPIGGKLRGRLPYGIWRCADGREFLFCRNYIPRFERAGPGQPAERADPFCWVHWIDQQHFYDDGSVPWCSRKTKRLCERVLADWGVS